jgi:hypothetical protein
MIKFSANFLLFAVQSVSIFSGFGFVMLCLVFFDMFSQEKILFSFGFEVLITICNSDLSQSFSEVKVKLADFLETAANFSYALLYWGLLLFDVWNARGGWIDTKLLVCDCQRRELA